MEGLINGDASKIRKRGCSPSSSTSSLMQTNKFKRAILVGRKRVGGGSSTPVPTWRLVGSSSPSVVLAKSPSVSGRSKGGQSTVSARKLAATLWEMNEVGPIMQEEKEKRVGRREERRRRCKVGWDGNSGSGRSRTHLSDPSHSPVSSERMERSGNGTHRKRDSSIFRGKKMDSFDSASIASFMEVETRSRCPTTPSGSTSAGAKPRLKDVSNALTTSKELLKIISRLWAQEGHPPSSSKSLISALHTELERARLQVNQLIQHRSSDHDHKDIDRLLRRFAEEKAAWKQKEQKAVEYIAGELEVERKLRRRLESLNKKLGKELSETKAAFMKVVEELETEKKTRGIMEQVCDELARNIGEDKARAAEMKRESLRMQEEVEKERQMLQIAEALREERTQMKLSDARHLFEEKNAVVDKLKSDLEAFLLSKEYDGHDLVYQRRDGDLGFCQREAKGVEDGDNNSDNESELLHSVELNTDEPGKNRVSHSTMTPPKRISKRDSVEEEHKSRKSIFNQVARKSTSFLRSVSNVVEWGNHSKYEIDKQVASRSSKDDSHSYSPSHRELGREMGSPSRGHAYRKSRLKGTTQGDEKR